jgi:hypothetical protein
MISGNPAIPPLAGQSGNLELLDAGLPDCPSLASWRVKGFPDVA